ncbi:hypothetical protein A8D95_20725 [Burkholderia cenocepacia]|nr:hypothetical protein A8D84_17155 [Burkholderia cenocepacia]ONP66810.1 hypothetical protein A8D88_16385 [Burkholderia cenocepacia]ONP75650.1 hypothetical protein A8D94_12335 [Burkholderia cenocepacia]ONQ02249.1 hypothetical protein A8D97_31845 [Burkholderia cenocepacia]ONQ11115.1 hypothetical protein A8E00_28525 [Burkholderia cenocepacia]
MQLHDSVNISGDWNFKLVIAYVCSKDVRLEIRYIGATGTVERHCRVHALTTVPGKAISSWES